MAVNVEADLVLRMGRTIIYPAAARYVGDLAQTALALKELGLGSEDQSDFGKLVSKVSGLRKALDELAELLAHEAPSAEDESKYCRDKILPHMLTVRAIADELEGLVPDDLWPLPTYQEMLFIK